MDMCENTNFKGCDLSCPSIYYLFYDIGTSYLEYLTSHGLLYCYLSAYRPHHSCETALLNLMDNWLKAMDGSNLVGVVLLDLTYAFYLRGHDTLLSKISLYQASTNSMKWFKSYL